MADTLFGNTPYAVQQALQEEMRARALEESKLTPAQAAVYNASRAGSQLGSAVSGVGGAMGLPVPEDPRVFKAKAMKAVQDEIKKEGVSSSDFTTFYPKLIEKLEKYGLTDEAMQAASTYDKWKTEQGKTSAEIVLKNANAIKAMRETLPEYARLIDEFQKAEREGNFEKALSIRKKLDKETEAVDIVEEGVPGMPEWRQKVAYDKASKQLIGNVGGPYKANTGTNISLGSSSVSQGSTATSTTGNTEVRNGPGAGQQEVARVWGKEWEKFQTGYGAAAQVESRLGTLAKLAKDADMITGSAPEVRNEALRVINSLGLGSPAANAKLNNADLFDALTRQYVIPQMKMFGGSDSNEELKAMQASFANRKFDPETSLKIIRMAEKDIARLKETRNAFEKHTKAGKDPTSFSFAFGGEVPGIGNFMDSPSSRTSTASESKSDTRTESTTNRSAEPVKPPASPVRTPKPMVSPSEISKAREWYRSQGIEATDQEIAAKIEEAKARSK